jgi:hypothetical protein
MNNIENKNGLYDLLGIPETSVLPANPGDTLIIHVDEGSSEEVMWAYGNKVKELLPEYRILVLPRNVSISMFPEDYASRMIGFVQVK